MSEWIDISDYKDLPQGEWLVKVRDLQNGEILHHVARVHPNITNVGGMFYYDMMSISTLLAYTAIPEGVTA